MAKLLKNGFRDLPKAIDRVHKNPTTSLPIRKRAVPGARDIEIIADTNMPTSKLPPQQLAKRYETIEVSGSNGKRYKLTVPVSYMTAVPKVWEWTPQRLKVADAIASGNQITRIAKEENLNRMTIYAWLEHPEFRDHVDGLVLETGWANRRERIAGLSKVTTMIFKKLEDEFDTLLLTDKSIGPILTSLQNIAKHLGQEKGEFIESQKIDQSTTLNGAIGVGVVNFSDVLNNRPSEERALLEAEFNAMGDNIIRAITGEKE